MIHVVRIHTKWLTCEIVSFSLEIQEIQAFESIAWDSTPGRQVSMTHHAIYNIYDNMFACLFAVSNVITFPK